MDNMYILNYIVKREITKKGGKLLACFIHIKATFDTVDRKKMWV